MHVEPFSVDVVPDRDDVFLAVRGELDLLTVPGLEAQVGELREAGFGRVVLDLRDVQFADSMLVELLVDELRRDGDGGGAWAVMPGDGCVRDLLAVTGLLERVPLARGAAAGTRLKVAPVAPITPDADRRAGARAGTS